MEVKPGYKQTEVGVIPEEWEVKPLGAFVSYTNGKAHEQSISDSGRFVVVNSKFISTEGLTRKYSQHSFCPASTGDVLMVMSDVPNGRAIAKCYWVESDNTYTVNQRICILNPQGIDGKLLFYKLDRNPFYLAFDDGAKQTNLRKDDVLACPLGMPKSEAEQRAIATALSDVDGLLGGLDRLIAKKRDLKQAAMQQLLTGQTRLPGFHGEWEVKRLGEITDSLDNLRVPMNETQRATMKGDYPYCGANGVLGFVDNYVVDDDIILMAEDGGYFDEYETRPIAYRMTGKCWVNNHAHILKAKLGFDQGFIFYSLVHKNILPFLASGTRAKLNKSEMNKIEVRLAKEHPEQTAIAEVLTEMDGELAVLEQRREKTRALKQAMMQELLTGRTRLFVGGKLK